MEIIDIVDGNLQFVRKAERGESLNKNEYFKFVHIWVIVNNKILIQKRGYNRKWAPGKWATHTGVVASGEKEDICVVRELKEEIGIEIDLVDVELGFVMKPNNKINGIGFVYFIQVDDVDIVIDNDEVIDYKYVSIEELSKMINSNNFIHYSGNNYKKYFSKVFKKLEVLLEV